MKKQKIKDIEGLTQSTYKEWGGLWVKPKGTKTPVKPYRTISVDSNDPGYVNRVLVATPTLGIDRMEWVLARHGQTNPTNRSQVQYIQFMQTFAPFRYTVANAQNIIVKELIDRKFEWLLLIEDDTMPPADAFIRFNHYMRNEQVPVVSGLYFTKTDPPEPMLYRGRGTSFYTKWKMGDLVWCDGVPTGMLLIHSSILKILWDESPEYVVNGIVTRRVFDDPRKLWFDKGSGQFNTTSGTSDLEWCSRIMKDKIFDKAGWPEYQKKKYPFLIDTNIFCKHIDRNTGKQYP